VTIYTLLNIWQALFLATWTALWISIALVASVFSAELPLWMARHCWAPALLFAVFSEYEVKQRATLDPDRAYVFVMNHQSMLDIPVAFAFIPVNIRFVFKKILYWVPFLGWFIWRTKMVPVDRKKPQQAYGSLSVGVRRIRDGISIIAYPEGTRSTKGEILKFKRGPFVLAQAAGVPVVPVTVEGTGKVLPRSGFKIRPGKVRLSIGEPIETTDFGSSNKEIDRLRRRVRDSMIEMHLELGGAGGPREKHREETSAA
jgi:1-acyl-sn-glycerol-3-phosphate acyltransferase